MAPANRYKILVVALTGLACLVVLETLGRRGDRPPAPSAGDFVDPARLAGTEIDEATAARLFGAIRSGKRQVYDPVAWAVLRPDVTQVWDWPEHPDGAILARTNDRGFREDAPTPLGKTGPRVLVAGDSHTDAPVQNDETFPNVLEALLAERRGETLPGVEVLNAGVGGTGPYNYLGTLRRHLALRPDVFVAALYVGNDFTNTLQVHDFFAKRQTPPASADDQRMLMGAVERWGRTIVGNGFNQAFKFKRQPEGAEIALAAAVEVYLQIAALCEREGIAFLALVIPPKPAADLNDDRARIAEILETLELTAADYAINMQLAERFVDALRAHDVVVVDPTERLRAVGARHYWLKDHHLNVEGQAVVAEALLEPVLAALETR